MEDLRECAGFDLVSKLIRGIGGLGDVLVRTGKTQDEEDLEKENTEFEAMM